MTSPSSIQTRKSKKNTRKRSIKNKKYYGGNPPLQRSIAYSNRHLRNLLATPNKVNHLETMHRIVARAAREQEKAREQARLAALNRQQRNRVPPNEYT